MARSKLVFERSCPNCDSSFTTSRSQQRYCLNCVHKPCEQCGAKKDVRAKLCRKCDNALFSRERGLNRKRREPLPEISCEECKTPFSPWADNIKFCSTCANRPCEQCGKPKRNSTAALCRRCDTINRTGKPILWTRRKPLSPEQIAEEVEAFGLLPEKQYAFGYVIGVMFGDGSIWKTVEHPKHKRVDGSIGVYAVDSYRMRLDVTSQAFAERFAQEWNNLTGRRVNVWTKTRTNFAASTLKGKPDGYSVQLFLVAPSHAKLARYLSHLKYESDPAILLNFPLEVVRGFVHGMIDSEGYINPKKPERIDIANKDIKLLDTLVLMLNRLEFGGTVYTYPSQNVSHLVTHMPYAKFGV